LHFSGVPGSLLRTRAGSVGATLNLAQISGRVSSRPMVLPLLLLILAWPSRPMIRGEAVSRASHSGKVSP
jgi:hypothetical protein